MDDLETIKNDLEDIKHAPAELGLNDIIARRWSPRSFSGREIATEDLTRIMTAAGWAASSSNEQPWRFLVGRRGDDTYAKILDSLVEANQSWAQHAPVLILSVAAKAFAKSGAPNHWALHDTGAASATLCLEAIALGIHSHGMGGFDRDKARAHFAIPDTFEIGAVWALGYLGDPKALTGYQRDLETAPRSRKALSDFVFSAWEQAARL